VFGAAEQRLWHSTIDAMERQPDADMTSLQRVRSWITDGITLDLRTQPDAIDHDNTFSVVAESEVVRKRIDEYVAFHALTRLPADHPCPFGVQPLHVIIKPGRKPRLVVDLSRNLNDHLEYQYFSYTTVAQAVERATPGCWFSKLDLSNCFLSFPLHPSALPYFIFRFDNQLYQFTRMPFGLSSAPRICTELLAVPAFAMRQWGIDRGDRYLDDTLLTDESRESAERSLLVAQHTLTSFGLVINPDKTEGPAQRLAFLGIELDSVRRTMSCTPERLNEIRELLDEAAAARRWLSLPRLQTIVGKLQFATTVLPGARPFLHRMQWLINRQRWGIAATQGAGQSAASARRRTHFMTKKSFIRVDSIMRDDLAFWRDHLGSWNGSHLWRSARSDPFTFASDASLDGFGYYIESVPASVATAPAAWPSRLRVGAASCGQWSDSDVESIPASVATAPAAWPSRLRVGAAFCGQWSDSDAHLHHCSAQMIWCEMFAVLAALSTYRHVLHNSSVLFYVDNQPDVHTLNKQSTRSVRLAGLLREIYTIAVDCNIYIRAIHRPGVDNVLADYLSRTKLRDPDAIVAEWKKSQHSSSHPLLSVSVVHSQQFGSERARPSSS
jgi:hypothetical protein